MRNINIKYYYYYLLSVIIVIITVNNNYHDAVYEQVPHVWTRE